MSDLFDELDKPTATAEGGHVNHPSDRGGETHHGITIQTAREEGYTGRMVDMTAAQAKAIRRGRYYVRPGIHHLAAVSKAVAREIYDSAILHGPGVPARWLQRSLNALNRRGKDYADIPVDGAIGPKTAAALAAFLKRNRPNGERRLLTVMNSLQGEFVVSITENREANEDFLNGWIDNRVQIA